MRYYATQPFSPFEDAYRIALRSLEDSYSKQRDLLRHCSGYDHYYVTQDMYELESWFHLQRDRLERRIKESIYNQQQYYYDTVNRGYGYGFGQNRLPQYIGWDYDSQPSYSYTYTYLNSKELAVPTEAKTYIVVSSAGANETPKTHKTLAEAEKEAQRLARKFPAQEFTVFTSTKKYKIADKPVDVVVCV